MGLSGAIFRNKGYGGDYESEAERAAIGLEMKRTLLAAIVVAVLITKANHAQQGINVVIWTTGEDLYEHCTTPSLEDSCVAYIEGVADVLGSGDRVLGNGTCMPGGINGFRLREIVLDYLEQLPAETRKVTAAHLVALALATKFPCGSGSPKN